MKKYKVITEKQYGYQQDKSIEKLMRDFANVLNEGMGKNHHSLVPFIDFTKEFDTLCHRKLLTKLESIGIRGIAVSKTI